MTGDKKDREEKNLAEESPLIACLDALPPVFFTAGAFVVGKRLKSRIFTLGAVLAAAGGWMKVLWKLLLTGTKKDVPFLSRQMKYTMGTGFSLMAAGLIAKRKQLDGKKLLRAAGGFPQNIFFLTGCAGIGLMCLLAARMDHSKARSNWIEQLVNTTAQGAFLAGILRTIRGGEKAVK